MAPEFGPARPVRAVRPGRVSKRTRERQPTHPISVAQEALWLFSRLHPRALSYNETISIRKDGPLEVDALHGALAEIIRRHQAWRTTFRSGGTGAVQVVGPAYEPRMPVIDLCKLAPWEAERRAIELVSEISSAPYELARGPLLRPLLIRFPGEHHRLYLAMHHIIFDAVSIQRTVLAELVALYDGLCAGRPSPLPEPQVHYGDYARWQHDWISQARTVARLEHWRRRLEALPAGGPPPDRPRPATPRFRGAMLSLSLEAKTVAGLRAQAVARGATLFAALASAWALLLGRLCGCAEEVVFAVAVDLRTLRRFEPVVGYCLTPMPMRVRLGGASSVADVLLDVRNELLDGIEQLLPFERLVRELQPPAPTGANPVYQTMVVLEPPARCPDPAWSVRQLETEIGHRVGGARLDLELTLDERPDGRIEGRLVYDRDLFARPTAERIARLWSAIADAAARSLAADIGTVMRADERERRRLLFERNATATVRPPPPIPRAIAMQARRDPDAVAVSCGTQQISYGELVHQAETEAHAKAVHPPHGATRASPSHGVEAVVRELAAMYAASGGVAGGCCVLRDANGAPVAVSQRAAANLAAAVADTIGLHPGQVLLCADPPEAGVALSAWWPTLTSGARLVLAERHATAAEGGVLGGDGGALGGLLAEQRVDVVHASPAAWAALLEHGLQRLGKVRALCHGGPLSYELAQALLERCRALWNAYGLPETGWLSTLGRIRPGEPVTIGRPIANMRAYVVDERLEPVACGVPGELVLAGVGVAGARASSSTRFIVDPFADGRAYRTGAIARWRADGLLELLEDRARFS